MRADDLIGGDWGADTRGAVDPPLAPDRRSAMASQLAPKQFELPIRPLWRPLRAESRLKRIELLAPASRRALSQPRLAAS
jgi:hypothetical protein